MEELSYTGVINTMLCALDYLDRQGAPSLVAEETVEVLLAQFGNWDFNVVGLSEVLGSKTLHVMGRKAVVPFLEQISDHLGGDSDEALDAVLRLVVARSRDVHGRGRAWRAGTTVATPTTTACTRPTW